MQIRTGWLPDEIQYNLDCASEMHNISRAADMALRLYGDAARLETIWSQRERDFKKHSCWLNNREIEMEKYAAEIMAQLPAPRRARLLSNGLVSVFYGIWSLAGIYASWNYEDSTRGGCLEPFKKKKRILDRDDRPTKRVQRRLESASSIRSYVGRNEDELAHRKEIYNILGMTSADAEPEQTHLLFDDLQGQTDAARRLYRQNAAYSKFLRKDGKADRSLRKVTKRAALLAAAILGVQTVSAFARGEPVILAAEQANISVQLTRSIHSSGHGSMKVSIEGDDGAHIASLCVFQDMPVLDQLASLAMHVKSGHVGKVLETGNLYAVKEPSHPVVMAKLPKKTEAERARDLPDIAAIFANMTGYDAEFKVGMALYEEKFRHLYADAIAVHILGGNSGRDRRNLRRFRAMLAENAFRDEDI